MLPDITGKTALNVKRTGFISVNDDIKVQINGFEIQTKRPQALKVVYNGLEYEMFDIEGHLVLNRVYK